VEDSGPGIEAATASGAHVIRIGDPSEVTYATVAPHLWNVLIPMAGAGSRFVEAGHTFPKPLIDVDGEPMIRRVVENLAMPGRHIFLVNKEHNREYRLEEMLGLLAPGCDVVTVDELTEGAACTALLAERLIDDRPLLIANSDQWVVWDRDRFVDATATTGGLLPIFEAMHPKWSYAEVVDGLVVRVAEKNPISTHATCGIYWWRHGTKFVEAAHRMVDANDRTNGEFYIAPAYNYTDLSVGVFPVDEMWGLGTPEDLDRFLAR
jgi:NDP-sugar pyrophosphorylase family protein